MNEIDNIIKFVKERMADDVTGHDFLHASRVATLAKKMYLADQGNNKNSVFIIEAAGYLHDTIDEKLSTNITKSLQEINSLLDSQKVSQENKDMIFYIIQHMSYSKNIDAHYSLSIEGQYVQDADRLDALGAIGIARAFAYGGHVNQKIYDPQIKITTLTSHKQYRHHETTTYNHFFEKLLNLEGTMNTLAGKEEAIRRTNYIKSFLKEFEAEVNIIK